jgi:hypothetical protein
MMVDPAKAPSVVRDFEGVRLLKGGSGEIDKKADPLLSHWTDGIGYYCERESFRSYRVLAGFMGC